MNQAAFVMDLSAIADDGLFRTNPVWCIERLVKRWEERDASWAAVPNRLARLLAALSGLGVRPPRTALVDWADRYGLHVPAVDEIDPPSPGVAGLIVDVVSHNAFLVPLIAERSSEWRVDPTLPIRPATILPDLLVRLLHSLELPHLNQVPERLAFSLQDPLGRRSDGPSMHMAGLLAVVRSVNGNPPLFDRACCVLQPEGDQLTCVGSAPLKLQAFLRECGTGTLLVRGPDAEVKRFDAHFDVIWEVESLRGLARNLEQVDLLRAFFDDQPLSGEDATTVAARVHQLETSEHRYSEALNLAKRAEIAGFRPEVPNRIQRKLRRNVIHLYRHLGAYAKTAELARREHVLSRSGPIQSYEDQAEADLNYAAALYAPHRFAAIHMLLDPWRERLSTDPLLTTPLTRMKVFNTLGRAWAASGRDGWEDLFKRSCEILEALEPTDLPRTWCYLAQACLQSGRLRKAEEVLARIEAHPGLGEMSRRFLRTLQADAARRRGRVWVDPVMELATTTSQVGHPFAFYLQATARQPGRRVDDALDRFRRAREFLTQDEPDGDPENVQRFLAGCLRLAEAAWKGDRCAWNEAALVVERYAAGPAGDGFATHYADCFPFDRSAPDKAAAERLLSRVPFF